MQTDYWEETIRQAFDEAGIVATQEQIDLVVGAVEVSHENRWMAHGYDAILRYNEAQVELDELIARQARHAEWKNSTKPCPACFTTGVRQDIWNRDTECDECNGKGRVPNSW